MIPLPPLHVECYFTFRTMATHVHYIILRSGEAIVISVFTESGTVRAKSLNVTCFETEIFAITQRVAVW